ncbi:MAG: hypothetical protein ACWGOX_03500 [Desulforhopalus sp.]
MSQFLPRCLPLLIGSLPFDNHAEATKMINHFTPEIPIWPQLPAYAQEGMIAQFVPGLPGVTRRDGRLFVDSNTSSFDSEVLEFYEEYLGIAEEPDLLDHSRFSLSREVAEGFHTFLASADENREKLSGLKGQTTGPITFCTGLVDEAGRAIFYNEQLRDIAVKHLAMKARWQVRKMSQLVDRTIMFFDEPALAGLGSSAFITMTKEEIIACLEEVFDAVRTEGCLTGVHVCANTEWPVVFDSGVDIVSYDAYSFFDRLILYPELLVDFFAGGKVLATGIVPTTPELIEKETIDSLVQKWFAQTAQLQAHGIALETVFRQSFITPSCGTGTVSRDQALKVLELTRGVSARIREEFP